jgi:hypothetical protein
MAIHGYAGGARMPIAAQTIVDAARIGEYYKAGAINAIGGLSRDLIAINAAYLLERIAAEELDEVSERDLFSTISRTRFRKKSDLAPALQRLVDHSYLAPLPIPSRDGTRGRPPSARYKVHPSVAKIAKAAKNGAQAGQTVVESNSAVSAIFATVPKDFAHSVSNGQAADAPRPPAQHQQSMPAPKDNR